MLLSGARELNFLKNQSILKENEHNSSLFQIARGVCRVECTVNGMWRNKKKQTKHK